MLGTDNSIAIMRLLQLPGVGPAKVNALIDLCRQSGFALNELGNRVEIARSRLSNEQIALFRSENGSDDLQLELHNENVKLISTLDQEYPSFLSEGMKEKAPPLIYCKGNVQLFSHPSIGFCGSRKASVKGLETAKDCSSQLAQLGFTIVSGYAAGVDITAHTAALAAGGTTIIVLPEGILNFRIKQEIKDVWDWDRVLIISQFEPKLPWAVHNAMARNAIICSLSKAMILIEAGTTGGSIAAGRTCLAIGRPLFAPVYEGMPDTAAGNRLLLKEGASPLGKNRHTNMAAIVRVAESIRAPNVTQQVSLFA